jgi:hypothetical protein
MKRETKTIELKIRVWGWLIVLKRETDEVYISEPAV